MSKTISGSKLADCSKSLFAQLDSLARKSKLVVRHSPRFSASGFTLALLKAVIIGKASFTQLASNLGRAEIKSGSRQALWARINNRAVSFLLLTVFRALSQRWGSQAVVVSSVFTRILIEDSSQAKLPKSNAEEFPAHGNGKGSTAGCKCDLAFDLLTGEPVLQSLHLATTQDRDLGKDLVDLVQKGDLVLRDMGYFSLDEFGRIESRGAFWLSRVPVSVKISDPQGRSIESILRRSKLKRIEAEVLVGTALFPARFVAVRATPQLAGQRRRERRQKAREIGKQPCKDALLRDGWHLMITNVQSDQMGTQQLFDLYATRWQIEITFRAWKQSTYLTEALNRRSNPFHLQALMLAAFLLLILTMKTASLLQCTYQDIALSIEKLAINLTSFILELNSLQRFCAYKPDPRHLAMDTRSRQSLQETTLLALS